MKQKRTKKEPVQGVEKPVEGEQKEPPDITKRPTISELEGMLDREEDHPIEILPNGEVRAADGRSRSRRKPITLREDLGGEYAVA